ncbi:MAG TPA: hypothetical protein VFU22_04555 [Roseiflexaceae bacterium]|nr:hypothetical protein [Roseiflexaceae bacterium]
MPRALVAHATRRRIDFDRQHHPLFAGMLLVALLLSMSIGQAAQPSQAGQNEQIGQAAAVKVALARTPFIFIENVGQFARAARYALYGSSTGVALAEDGLWLTLHDRQGAPTHAAETDVVSQAARSRSSSALWARITPADRAIAAARYPRRLLHQR